jgi:DNA invertase Pin-like site-specific DNA recombinase
MSKVAPRHLERKAFVYVRQSSMAQVQQHRESAQRQYALRERAVRLGWRVEQVETIDDDQGQSGASAGGRGGFQRLVSEVALGRVGAVLGLEVSRLARSCVDWYRLLEVAALSRTLIVDEDGVYDPNHYNDRLLLGLKGTLSEAELHFLKSRMIGGRRNKARRGAFRIRLPVGYVWEEGEIRLDPDERIRDAVKLFFACFERLGSAAAVTRYFEDQRQPFPRRDGWGSLSVVASWGTLSISRAVEILHNPVYAGTYAYSRKSVREEDPEDPGTGGRILIPGTHPGYITLEHYERNLARLMANRDLYAGTRFKGRARKGHCLLQGIVLCGRCGRHMNIRYERSGSVLFWCHSQKTHRPCQFVQGRYVEPLVEEAVLEAVSREELELAVGALEKFTGRARELDRQWKNRIEAARYETEKAARRFKRVEPENRLVARTLEREWNARLEELERLEKDYAEVKRKPPFELTEAQREKILALAQDLPRLWRAETTSNSQRKEVIRLLIEDVTLANVDEPWSISVAIHWKTGALTRHRAERLLRHPQTTAPEVIARIETLWKEKTDAEIATLLNAEGYQSGYRRPFTPGMIAHLRNRRGWKKYRLGTRKPGPYVH